MNDTLDYQLVGIKKPAPDRRRLAKKSIGWYILDIADANGLC